MGGGRDRRWRSSWFVVLGLLIMGLNDTTGGRLNAEIVSEACFAWRGFQHKGAKKTR